MRRKLHGNAIVDSRHTFFQSDGFQKKLICRHVAKLSQPPRRASIKLCAAAQNQLDLQKSGSAII
jgi:hypothetical protein